MHPKYLMILMVIFISASVFGMIIEGVQPLVDCDQTDLIDTEDRASLTPEGQKFQDCEKQTLDKLTAFQTVEVKNWLDSYQYVGAGFQFLSGVKDMVVMDYNWMDEYEPYTTYMKFFLLGPLYILIIYGLFISVAGIIERVID